MGLAAVVTAGGEFTGNATVSGGTNAFTVVATDASGNVCSQQYEISVTGQAKTFTYDANGNLLSDGMWYTD